MSDKFRLFNVFVILLMTLTTPSIFAESPNSYDHQLDTALNDYVAKVPDVLGQTQRIMSLFDRALDYASNQAEQKGTFESGSYQDSELGKADIFSIDDSQVVRIVEPMGSEIIFVHSPSVNQNSPALQKYILKQNSVAEREGRNVIVAWHNDGLIESTQTYEKSSKWSLRYWQGYIAAVHQPATFDSFCFGVLSGLAQATLTAGLGVLQNGFTPHVAVLSLSVLGFGSFIGTFAGTYRNIVFYSNSKWAQILKQSVVSYAFAYMIFSINQIALGDPHHLTTLSEYMNLIFNIFLSTSAKNEFSQWARIKDLGRGDLKEYTFKFPFTNKSFKFSEKDVNYQIKVQLTTQAIRTADLLGYHLSIPLATGIYKVEIGKLLLWLSAPIVNFSVRKWAQKNYPETAKELGIDTTFFQALKENLKNTIGFIAGLPRRAISYPLNSAIQTEVEVVNKSYFDSLVKSLNRPQGKPFYSTNLCIQSLASQ